MIAAFESVSCPRTKYQMGAVRCEADANWVLRLPVRTVQLRWVHLATLIACRKLSPRPLPHLY